MLGGDSLSNDTVSFKICIQCSFISSWDNVHSKVLFCCGHIKLMPIKFLDTPVPCNNDKWVLLKCGRKVYPVQIVGGKMKKGWSLFWDDHDIKSNFKLVFESERQVIFNVLILDQNLTRIGYKWTNPDANHAITTPSSGWFVLQLIILSLYIFFCWCSIRLILMCLMNQKQLHLACSKHVRKGLNR